jgi:hypothetical protein
MRRANKVVPIRQTSDEGIDGKSLLPELKTLRDALEMAFRDMQEATESADRAKFGSLVAKLTDSIVRARLAEKKHGTEEEDSFAELRRGFERRLREIGRGEPEPDVE